MKVWRDGLAVAGAGGPDRGLEFGDGLFETIAAQAGRLRLLDGHLARLRRGCERLGIAMPDADLLRQELATAAAVAGAEVVKLILSRGPGGHGYAPAPDAVPVRHVLALPARRRPAEYGDRGVVLRVCTTRLAEQPLLAGLKHLNRLEQVLARREWSDPEVPEGLMLDVHGRVVSGTMSNVFAVIREELITPALTRAGVAGVMRAALLDRFRESGAHVVERDLLPGEFGAASEVFLSNSLIGVWPVRELEGRGLAPGPWARRAQAWVAGW